MKTDLYTKAVLTVIALALSAIALQQSLPSAFAQSGIQKVIICDASNSSTCAEVHQVVHDGVGMGRNALTVQNR